jgi:two-component system cell cycle response regulator DivK
MKKILLVEDNPANRKLMGDILRRAGYELIEASTAEEGIEKALLESFDLVVMDVQLPGTDGITATGVLRSHRKTKDLIILAVTAHAMRGDERRLLDAGFDGYMAKPIAYREFLAEIARLLHDEA